MYIQLKGGKPFALAGLWEDWNSPEGSRILSCTIITTQPNDFMKNIHDRMPVILPESAYQTWLNPMEMNPALLQPLLQPYPAQAMSAYQVSTLVNSPANELADCIQPVNG